MTNYAPTRKNGWLERPSNLESLPMAQRPHVWAVVPSNGQPYWLGRSHCAYRELPLAQNVKRTLKGLGVECYVDLIPMFGQ